MNPLCEELLNLASEMKRLTRRIVGVAGSIKEMSTHSNKTTMKPEVAEFLRSVFETPEAVTLRNEIEALRINGSKPDQDSRPFKTTFEMVWGQWEAYAKQAGFPAGSHQALGRELKKEFVSRRSNGKAVYHGLRLRRSGEVGGFFR